MSLQGDLEFRDANKITFIGGSSNTLIDLTTGSLGVGVTGTSLSSNLHVAGNKIKVGDNIFSTDGPHARLPKEVPLKKYPEIVFDASKLDGNDTTNTYVQAGYTVTGSSVNSSYHPWKAFDDVASDTSFSGWLSQGTTAGGGPYNSTGYIGSPTRNLGTESGGTATVNGEYLVLEMPHKVKVSYARMRHRYTSTQQAPTDGYFYGSNNGTDWQELKQFSGIDWVANPTYTDIQINATQAYNRLAIVPTREAQVLAQGDWIGIGELKYYGYEEDPPAGDTSVDTTFASIMNTPQTTGANVYVDAKLSSDFTNQVTGPTPVGTAAVHDNTNKYWELTGALTSNITVEANTFLEGDQPHAVSVWFNSSNLEANVSNTCVFSVSDQEHLNSQNLNLQSNTWHNLTYAYQGEGGSRVTYLDGRKVAEDQAEDTFGEYPPFDMTEYSQGGYVVSASSEYISGSDDRRSWKVFDGVRTAGSPPELWQTNGSTYTSATPGVATGAGVQSFIANGVTFNGHWLKLKLPHKLLLNWLKVESGANDERRPWKGAILGSNDDVNWYTLKSFDGDTASTALTWYDGGSSIDVSDIVINSQLAYNYILFVIEETKVGTGHNCLVINQMHLYGHRENDLVRLPDPTNVLKYPHVALTGPAQRGYVASASNENLPNYPAWEAFDDKYTDIASTSSLHRLDRWQTTGGYASSGTPRNADGTETTTLAGSSPSDYDGEWLQLESPNKVNITSYRLYNSTDYVTDHNAHTVVLLGSNTGIDDWVDIGSGETVLSWSPNTSTANGSHTLTLATVNTSGNTGFYKYHRLVVRKVTNQTLPVIYQFQLYGTEEATPVPIQIGGGNIDKVANFRVYDKFVGEDQALEIWDAQKDEFGRAKSSMTLQKGRLGLGTTEPEGRLAVLDEPHNLEEFPPRAMTGYKTYFEGHGEFCVSASSVLSDTYRAWYAFDHYFSGNNGWVSDRVYNGSSPGEAQSGLGATIFSGRYGEYIDLKLPYGIKVNNFIIKTRPTQSGSGAWMPEDSPGAGYLYGSNNGTTWTEIKAFSGLTYGGMSTDGGTQEILQVDSTTAYKYLRLQVTHRAGQNGSDDYLAIGAVEYFGTREQGQSVLHDGQLTLTKSLNVPRIGPALDADDTPRRDRLVVEYNTSTNPTFEGAVRDTSGRGLDGVMMDGAYYDASAKAFEFDGFLDGLVRELPREFVGDPTLSFSMWINQESRSTNGFEYTPFLHLGYNATNQRIEFRYDTNGRYCLDGFGVQMRTNDREALPLGKWMHVCGVLTPGAWSTSTKKLYINGEFVTTVLSGTGTTNIPAETTSATTDRPPMNTSRLELGPRTVRSYAGDTSNPTSRPGQLSSIKLYDTALTAQEVKTLYNMGRNGSVANPQPLHIAAPLYAPGTIVQSQYASTPLNNTVRQLITGGELSDAANDVDYLDMNFKPKFANSSILLTAMINNNCTHVASFGFKEDGTLVRTQGNNTNSTGGISTIYDGTPGASNATLNRLYNINIQVMVPANGTHTRRYNVAANSYWDDVSYNLYINDRNSNDMRSISNMVVYEIVN